MTNFEDAEHLQEGWKVWSGTEVEGRLRGIRTLFLRKPPKSNKVIQQYDHIYINSHWWQLNGNQYDTFIRVLLDAGKLVSMELSPDLLQIVPDEFLLRCHLVIAFSVGFAFSIPQSKLEKIKPDDEIRLDLAPYVNMVATWNCFSMAYPKDYLSDRRYE